VAITFGANAGAVSEHVLMLMLATYRRLMLAGRRLREGVWLRQQLRARQVSFDELIARSDVLSIHVPLTPATKGLIGAATIARMKSGAIVINAARGGILDEAALYDSLVSGKLLGAGLDVFATEPADTANPSFRLDQVVVTPHTAGSVIDLEADIARHAFTNMQSVLRGTPLPPDDVVLGPSPRTLPKENK